MERVYKWKEIRVKAIIKTGGKQYTVSENDVILVEKLDTEEGKTVDLTDVLAIIDKEKLTVGKPLVEGAKVTARVLSHGKDKKVIVFKYKPKKGYHKTQGHRQAFSKIKIEKIAIKAASPKKEAAEAASEKEVTA